MTIRALHGDCLDVIPRLVADGVVVDAVVTDPPYHLTGAMSEWTARRMISLEQAAARGDVGRFERFSKGFMGQQWDGGDIAFRPETWRTIGTALKPGGFLVAFGGTRTHHRLACAIEDAGFVIQDCLMWLFATGFPKGRTQLKPAYQPIILAYRPGGKRTLSIDECRIPLEGDYKCGANGRPSLTGLGDNYDPTTANRHSDVGRWPANLLHDNSDEVLALFPQTGRSAASDKRNGRDNANVFCLSRTENWVRGHNDDGGSAARFFFSAKAGNQDRFGSKHPTVKPVDLMRWLVQLVTPPTNGLVLDPFAGSGTTGVAALAAGRNAVLIEREPQWFADIQERLAFYDGEGRHSLDAKARHRTTPHGVMPLFEWPA